MAHLALGKAAGLDLLSTVRRGIEWPHRKTKIANE